MNPKTLSQEEQKMTTNETKQDNKSTTKTHVRQLTDSAARKRLGWQRTMFCEARFDVVRKALNPENQEKWGRQCFANKCLVVMDFVRKGYVI
jgi:hypothetical protein